MPLQAILVTNDRVSTALKENKKKVSGEIVSNEHAAAMQKLLGMGFDHILTTNYSYELEHSVQPNHRLEENRIIKLMSHTPVVNRAEAMYMLHTYNELMWGGRTNKVWHIHGESRKPDSMILGHYYYANLLQRLCTYVKKQEDRYLRDQENGIQTEINSWADAFILGDLYVLGFGFDVSEFDLWWLLNRKKREKANTGTVYFYSPGKAQKNKLIDEKEELLRVFDVEIIDCGFRKPDDITEAERNRFYQKFYRAAIQNIETKIRGKKGELSHV